MPKGINLKVHLPRNKDRTWCGKNIEQISHSDLRITFNPAYSDCQNCHDRRTHARRKEYDDSIWTPKEIIPERTCIMAGCGKKFTPQTRFHHTCGCRHLENTEESEEYPLHLALG